MLHLAKLRTGKGSTGENRLGTDAASPGHRGMNISGAGHLHIIIKISVLSNKVIQS